MRVFHIKRRDGISRCNKAKPKDSLIPMDAPGTEGEEGEMNACWKGETR